MKRNALPAGFSLIEVMVALLLATLVVLGSVRIASAIHSAWRHQQNLSALQHNARTAFTSMEEQVSAAGFTLTPWSAPFTAISSESSDALTSYSDRLVVSRMSAKNCFGNPNPVPDADGAPAYHLLESAYWVSSSHNLNMRCRYGPETGTLVTQLNGFGLLEDVHAMQLMFAEDTSGDLNADRWVHAGSWSDEQAIMAVRIGLLLATPEKVQVSTTSPYLVLDQPIVKANNGRAYRVFEAVIPLRGRIR